MKELNRTTRLFIAAVIAIVVIGIGYLTMKKPTVVFKIDTNLAIGKVLDTTGLISPVTLSSALNNKAVDFAMIDLRNSDEYSKGHIGEAVNIPVRDLLKQNNLKKLKELTSKHPFVVLYGNDELQASSPALLLKQIGYDNLKVLQGGYTYFMQPLADSLYVNQPAAFISEASRIDATLLKTNEKAASTKSVSGADAGKAEKPKKVELEKKPASAGGGC
jgi:rhodanese-related sulfurtransferase